MHAEADLVTCLDHLLDFLAAWDADHVAGLEALQGWHSCLTKLYTCKDPPNGIVSRCTVERYVTSGTHDTHGGVAEKLGRCHQCLLTLQPHFAAHVQRLDTIDQRLQQVACTDPAHCNTLLLALCTVASLRHEAVLKQRVLGDVQLHDIDPVVLESYSMLWELQPWRHTIVEAAILQAYKGLSNPASVADDT